MDIIHSFVIFLIGGSGDLLMLNQHQQINTVDDDDKIMTR